MKNTPLSKLERIYLAVWRKALDGEEIKLEFPNLSSAVTARSGLYRIGSRCRRGEIFDPKVAQSMDSMTPRLIRSDPDDKSKPCTIIITPKLGLSGLENQLAALGITDEDLMTEEERMISADLSDFPFPERKEDPNPFYSRED